MGSSGGTLASSRWNPTKEQINMLENLYKQGVRTPSAEQIQQITSRLRTYGHIEGKNVFYWFQNHKARQRQKQKQERMAFFNRYVHKAQPVFPPCANGLFRIQFRHFLFDSRYNILSFLMVKRISIFPICFRLFRSSCFYYFIPFFIFVPSCLYMQMGSICVLKTKPDVCL